MARMERREGLRWIEVWKRPLLNDVAPVEVLVSSDGLVVTFDNWHSMGHGEDAIVIYAAGGQPTCQWSLDDLLPMTWVDNLPRSVSSIQWRDDVSIRPGTHHVRIPVALPLDTSGRTSDESMLDASENSGFIELHIDLQTCAIRPPKRETWERAMSVATAAQKNGDFAREGAMAEFRAPLHAPAHADETEWRRYLAQALDRATDSADKYPSAFDVVLVSTTHDNGQHSSGLRGRLDDCANEPSTIIVGSPSQAALVEALVSAGRGIESEALVATTIVLVLDDGHYAQGAAALAASAARLVQVDPTRPLPQSAANLAAMSKAEQERVSERRERERRAPRHRRWWLDS